MFYTRWRSGYSSLFSVTWRVSPLMAHEVYLCIRLESSASRKHRGRKKEKMGCSDALHLERDILSKNNCWENNRKRKRNYICRFSSVQFSHSVMSDFLQPYGLQHARPPYPSPTPGVYPNSCTLSWRCHPTISSSVTPFSSCLQSFPASGSFPMSQLFASGGQSRVSASASVLPMNTQDWSPCSPRDSQESSPTPHSNCKCRCQSSIWLKCLLTNAFSFQNKIFLNNLKKKKTRRNSYQIQRFKIPIFIIV